MSLGVLAALVAAGSAQAATITVNSTGDAAASLALLGMLFSAYLLVVQAFVIEAFCIWCVVNDVLIAPALAVLTALRLRS